MKRDLIPKPVKKYQTTERNDTPAVLLFLVFMILAILISTSACGLYYEYPGEDTLWLRTPVKTGGPYMVPEVVDGDTIILENRDRIRLLGINTPEEGMYFYHESKEVLEMIVLDREVMLEKDISDVDIYGRKLRYVFQESLFVNLEMVKRGFANIYTCPPDVKYAEDFLEAQKYARENNLGLWEASGIGEIKVNIVYDAPGNDNDNINGEYVLLENTGSTLMDTAGWTIKDSGTNIYRFGSYKFHPGTSLILYSGSGRDSEGIFYWNSPKPVWNNDFDTMYLRDKKGLLISIYNY